MSAQNKASAEVVKFLTLLAKLKEWSDDDAEKLPELALADEAIRELCLSLLKAAGTLQRRERSRRDLFTAPVDPKFISDWRDFEERFAYPLLIIRSNAAEAGEYQLLFSLDFYEQPVNWKRADFYAAGRARAIEAVFDFAHSQVEKFKGEIEWRDFNPNVSMSIKERFDAFISAKLDAESATNQLKDLVEHELQVCDDEARKSGLNDLLISLESEFDDEDDPMPIEEGVKRGIPLWKSLQDEAGFDLRGVLRRRELIPFVLVPRHVAKCHDQMSSIYQNLRQAHEAFVFGAPLAALALMRSIMEIVLSEHYGAQGDNLSEQISNVRKILPACANASALHRLRRFANVVLHPGSKNEFGAKLESGEIETEIVSLLRVLRALVEGVPRKGAISR